MNREVPLVRGGVGHIESADAQHVVVDIGMPSPPGSTVELLVANAPLGVKVRSCRRLPEVGVSGQSPAPAQEHVGVSGPGPAPAEPTRYRVEGRWISLSRVQREALGIEL